MHKGKRINLVCMQTGEEKIFSDVPFIPTLRSNIISLGQMSEQGNKVVLQGEFLWVHDNNERLLMKVKRSHNRLYQILLEESQNTCLLTKSKEDSWLWHSRLGHVNFNAMSHMKKNNMVMGFPMLVQPKEECMGCLMAKQTRTPFQSQRNYGSGEALELVHDDLCGPISPSTPSRNRHFLLLVDDYSRMMWVYFYQPRMKHSMHLRNLQCLLKLELEKGLKLFVQTEVGSFALYNLQATVIMREFSGITQPLTPHSRMGWWSEGIE